MKIYTHFYGEEEMPVETQQKEYSQPELVALWLTAYKENKSWRLVGKAKGPLWTQCIYDGCIIPKEHALKVKYRTKDAWIHPRHHKTLYQDWQGETRSNLTDPPINAYDEKGKATLVPEWASDQVKSARINRNTTVYTIFDHGFSDHVAGHNKNFIKPDGDAVGIEIEMNFVPIDERPDWIMKLLFSKWIKENYPAWSCERDGSIEGPRNNLTGGLELVSPPMHPDDIKRDLKPILAQAKQFGGVGFKAMNRDTVFGIHITHNLYGQFSKNNGDRFVYLVNNPIFRDFWNGASQRSTHPKFAQFCAFYDIPQVKDAMRSQKENHYRATFPRGENSAIETRIFRSNLNFHAVSAMIDLVILTSRYVMDNKNSVDDPVSYATFLKASRNEILLKWIRSWDGFSCLKNRKSQEFID